MQVCTIVPSFSLGASIPPAERLNVDVSAPNTYTMLSVIVCVCFFSLCKWNGYNYGTANTVLAALPSDVYCASQGLGRKKR